LRANDVRALAALLLVAGALRFALVELVFPIPPMGDERHYVDTATHLALGLGHRSNLRHGAVATPPLHSFLLSLAVDTEEPPIDPFARTPRRHAERYVDAERLLPLLRVQALVGTLLVGVTALLAGALLGRQAALLAGAAAAVYPEFLAYSHYLWSTLLFAALLSGGLLLLWRAREAAAWGPWAAAGAVFGLAALTREEALPVAAVCCGAVVLTAGPGRRAARAGRAALLVVAMLATIAPWTLRNERELGRFVLVSDVGWMALAEGNVRSASGARADASRLQRFRRQYFGLGDEAERASFARQQALTGIVAAQPRWLLDKLVENAASLYRPDSFLYRKLASGAYGHPSSWQVRSLLLATSGSYLAVASLAVIGVAAAPPAAAGLALATAGTVTAIHVVANASSRYRMALMPLLLAFAAHGLLVLRRRDLRLGPRRRALCAAALLLLWVGGTASFARDFEALWWLGRYASGAP
jgi:4-amino-4-deoxy-L-arabinose transferase-like glycosyltransferase